MSEEFEFLVKIEGYKEKHIIEFGCSYESARNSLIEKLNIEGFMDIQYVL